MDNSPATQSRKPKTPVTALPNTNVRIFDSGSDTSAINLTGSPVRKIQGASNTADPRFVQYASWIVELLHAGSDDLMRTACSAIINDENAPYTSEMIEGVDAMGRLLSGTTPIKKPTVTAAVEIKVCVDGFVRVQADDTAIVKGKTSPRAI
jgi:hypothetical protein